MVNPQLKYQHYDFAYVIDTNITHSMHRFWDTGLNR